MEEKLRQKLNDMFDIEGAKITKTQACPVGRWVFTILMTLLFCGLFGVCVWGAMLFYGQALFYFIIALLSLALAFGLFRLWLGFAADIVSARFAEETTFLRKGDERYYYTRGNYVEKFEYEKGYIAVTGKSYDKFEDKANYSALAGRFDKALQRRSSSYSTMTPAFWFEAVRALSYEIRDDGITAQGRDGRIALICGADGKIRKIDYAGNGYLLYDSSSPVRLLDCKLPGKYHITYTFAPGAQEKIVLRPLFGTAMADFLMTPPDASCVEVAAE